jgi:hypothetical protein
MDWLRFKIRLWFLFEWPQAWDEDEHTRRVLRERWADREPQRRQRW